jgi:2-dehydropantoate 2-reductase
MNEQNGTRKTIAVIGMGPVGQILSVHLQETGHRVVICDMDKAKMHLIKKEGIRLMNVFTKQVMFPDTCTNVVDIIPYKPDIVVFCVKAYHLPDTIKQMVDFPRQGVIYMSAQNGIDTEVSLAEAFGESNTLRMVVNFAGVNRSPNVTNVSFFTPPNYIASMDDSKTAVAEEWAAMLNGVNMETHAVDSFEILRRVWEKCILNSCVSPLCGVSQMNMKEVMAVPDMVDIIEQVIMESITVAKAESINFEVNFNRHCLRYLRKSGSHFPSLAIDLLNKRPTEIDFMNGKFVEYGKKHYIPTPMHLAFTNMVKAMSQKHMASKKLATAVIREREPMPVAGESEGQYYLGIDLGSAYTKIALINDEHDLLYHDVVRTLSRDKKPLYDILDEIHRRFPIAATCAAGYGRENFPDAHLTKTEIHCAARGAYQQVRHGCNIIDIGAEDIKIVQVDDDGMVAHFYMNTKCASGTGAFLTEMAEKVEIPVDEMSKLASMSSTQKELNSFCTVFAKTEVMKWTIDQTPVEDVARGIYLSLVNRIHKMKLDLDKPIHLAGGVVAYHPFIRNLLEERFGKPVTVLPNPQFCVAMGAALFAQKHAKAAAKAVVV